MRRPLVVLTIMMASSAAVGVAQAREISFWGHDFDVNDTPATAEFRQSPQAKFKAEVDHSARPPERAERHLDER